MSFWHYKVADTGVAFSGDDGPYIMYNVGAGVVPPRVGAGGGSREVQGGECVARAGRGAGKWRGVMNG